MNRLNPQQVALKRRWDENGALYMNLSPMYTRIADGASASTTPTIPPPTPTTHKFLGLSTINEDDRASTVVPPVTVVLEGRSICHCIYLNKHTSYESFAAALRRMFVVDDGLGEHGGVDRLDLSNAVPGYLVAYEDMEDDLLLAGDLGWKDFVRVAKRIRIIPTKASRRKFQCGGAKCD